jgi:sugar lactone lactonase YvrE
MKAEQVTPPVAYHGEGPFWDDGEQRIRFVDMLAGDIVTLLPSGTVTRRHVGDVAAVLRRREEGGFVVAIERGFALLDEDWRPVGSVPVFDSPSIRMNEGGCDPQGRLYCGSMSYQATAGAGGLYRLDQDLSVHVVLPEVTIPNGLVWSADGATVFHSDTGPAVISAYDFDAERGLFENQREFARFDPETGVPDGVAIDEEGGLWVALWGGGGVQRYAPDGSLSERIEVDATNVTACAFAGEGSRTLYITTSQEEVDVEQEPAAGALFVAEVGVGGAAVGRFAG